MRILTIRDFCYISDGNYSSKYPRSDEFVSVGIPFIRANNLVNGTVVPDDMYYISPDKHAELRKGHLQEGDVLITTRGNIGQTAIVPEKFHDANINAQIVLLRVDRNIAIPQYLAYALHSESVEDQIRRSTTGTALKQLPVGKLENIKVKIHPYSEQQRIVTVMHQVDELIYARRKQLAKLDQLVKSRFIELFGDTILNPFGWEKDSLGTVCDVRDGTHDSPTYYEIGYPLVTSKNVTGGKIDLTDCSFICEEDFNKINERSKVDIGDIIMPMIGTVGKPVIVDMEPNFAIKNVALIKFKADSRVLNIYIRALLQSDYFDDVVLSKVRGGTQKFISLGDIRKLEILVPPMELQNQFAAFVKQTDKSKFEIQQSLGKLELLKKSLMQQYFG